MNASTVRIGNIEATLAWDVCIIIIYFQSTRMAEEFGTQLIVGREVTIGVPCRKYKQSSVDSFAELKSGGCISD